MTNQIKVPLLPLPPVEERIVSPNREVFKIVTYFGTIYDAYWSQYLLPEDTKIVATTKSNFDSRIGFMADEDIAGILPPFTVVDGQIVFEVK